MNGHGVLSCEGICRHFGIFTRRSVLLVQKNGPAAGRLSAVRSGYVGYCLSCRPVRISFFRPGAVESGSVQAGQIAVGTGVSHEDDLEDQRGVAGYAGRSR